MRDNGRDPNRQHSVFTGVVAAAVAVFIAIGLYLQETGRWNVDDRSTRDRTPVEYETEWGR